jgi:proline iminopeptidase
MDLSRREALGAVAAALAAGAPLSAFGLTEKEGRAVVPGGTVWWKKVGEGPKTPLLTLHGGPGAGHNYLLPLAALAEGRPVIFYDQLGCGKADSPADESIYTIPRAAAEVDAVRKALDLDRIVLFGHSWGSMLAIEYLCEGRGRGVEKLILGGALASVPQANAGMQRLIAQMPGGARLKALEAAHQESSPEYEKLTDQFYHLYVSRADPWPPELLESLDVASKSIAYRVMNGPNEFTIIGTIKDWDRRKDLAALKLRIPTLITTGDSDEVTLDCHETIHRAIPGSKLEIFKGCGHMTMNDKPAEYVASLRRFMSAA